MTENNASPKKRRGLFNSIRMKITLILLVIGATFGVSGYMVYTVFERVSGGMFGLTATQLPRLELSTEIAEGANKTKDSMITLMIAGDNATLSQAQDEIAATEAALTGLIEQLYPSERAGFENGIATASSALNTLGDARGDVLRNEAMIATRVAELQTISETLQFKLTDQAQEAYKSLTEGGASAIDSIDKSVSHLIDHDFNLLQDLLGARAEVNLLSGTAIASGLTKDPDMAETLSQLASTSQWRLNVLIRRMESVEQDVMDTKVLRENAEVLKTVIQQSLFPSEALRRAAIEARNKVDEEITVAIDNMGLELMISAELVNSNNRKAIQGLLENEVGFLNQLLDINTAVSFFQVSALNIATASTVSQVEASAESMNEAMSQIEGFMDFAEGAFEGEFSLLQAMNNPTTGLAALQIAKIKANAAAEKASADTAMAVLTIAGLASDLGKTVQGEIAGMADGISVDVAEAERNMFVLGGVTVGVFVAALLLTQIWISNPLNRISNATENLAGGDRSPIEGFDRASIEIYRIASSLAIFRNGLVEKEEMSRLAEAERQERQDAQDKAVHALGEGLSRLSRGDLTASIDEALTEGYEQLRTDFNNTLHTLNSTMAQVIDAAASMQGGSGEISQASEDLSHRTESQAATLEQTAAALDELTASVKSAAEGARNVEKTVGEARGEAEASGVVVNSAVNAMTEIEQSSNHISQIISVIDDIAFQTNLLALNAGVEAARAGEAGRGFAVVASEVRALAQRSSDAAMEIKTLISSSSKQVESGVELVGQAGEALKNIMERVNHISELVSGIANGAEEQSTGLYEINTGMTQLDQVTQQNAAMVEEATAASQLLSTDANQLAELVSQFQTDKSAVSAQPSQAPAGPSAHSDDLGDFSDAMAGDQDDWLQETA